MKTGFLQLFFFIVLCTSTYAQSPKTVNSNLQSVITHYIAVKESLVQSNSDQAGEAAIALLNSLNQVQKNELTGETFITWNKLAADLKEDAEHISSTKEITHQRDHFISLSQNMYTLAKTSSFAVPLFYQFCPMANKGKGANWLSLENKIKNPYYGNKMLSCGKVTEVLQ